MGVTVDAPASPERQAVLTHFIATYGYLAVFVGTLLEGETILLAAGFAAHRGLLDWQWVLVTAIAGGTLGDLCAFLLGRWKGAELIARFPFLARNLPRMQALMARYHAPFILAVRFLYGLRIAGPLILGAGDLPLLRFAFLNFVGAILWASLIVGAGYVFGVTIQAFLADLKRMEELIFIGIFATGALLWLWHRIHR